MNVTAILAAINATAKLLEVAAPIAIAAGKSLVPVFNTIKKLTSGGAVTQADLDELAAHNDVLNELIENAPDGDEPGQPGAKPV